jgi:tetratricopeptide (TPR) repeat protein
LDAFHQGNYREALRLAAHAAIDMPRSARVHELMSLALFSLKDYRGAAMEAHAAVALGPISDWAQLYSYFGSLETYTKPLDALVDYVRNNPASAEGRFLLAYHDLMMGHNPEGKTQLALALKLVPQDKIAQQLMLQLGGAPAATPVPPPPPAPGQPTAKPALTPLATTPSTSAPPTSANTSSTGGKDSGSKKAGGKDSTGKDATGKTSAGKDSTGKDAAGKGSDGKTSGGKEY